VLAQGLTETPLVEIQDQSAGSVTGVPSLSICVHHSTTARLPAKTGRPTLTTTFDCEAVAPVGMDRVAASMRLAERTPSGDADTSCEWS